MTDSGTVSSAETAGVAAAQAYQFLDTAVFYDLALIIGILVVRSVLIGVTAKAVSRGTADVKAKPCLYATLILCAVYVFANPTLQTDNLLRPLGVMTLVGVLVCKKAFWLTLEQAFYCSLIFCLLSIFIGDYSRREIDKRYPERTTVNKSMAGAIDAYAAKSASVPPTHEPSADILTALVRASTLTNAGVLTDMLSFLRAGLEAKAEVERLQKLAAQQAEIANLLAGGDGKVRNRDEEAAAMKDFLGSGETPARAVPLQQDTGKRRRGYMETYAEAKSVLEDVNRVASNNAAIVNMLSGIGEEVGDREEEMDKLHAALLAEAMKGTIDLSPGGESLSEEQIASLRDALGAQADSGEEKDTVLAAIASGDPGSNTVPAEALSSSEIQKKIEDIRTVAAAYAVEKDPLRRTLLEEAMRGKIDISVGGPAVTEEQAARILKSMETAAAPGATNAAPAQAVTQASIQAALDDLRKASATRVATAKKNSVALAKARKSARFRAMELMRHGAHLSWSGPYLVRESPDLSSYWFMRSFTFDRLRQQYRAPWEGTLLAVGVSMIANPVIPSAAPVATMSELVIAKATNASQKASAPLPSPFELLSKEERAKWNKALQKIEVTGVVGSAADVAAIVNGGLVRRGETIFVDLSGTNYPFRLTGISKKGKCQWEPMVGPKKMPASVTVTF